MGFEIGCNAESGRYGRWLGFGFTNTDFSALRNRISVAYSARFQDVRKEVMECPGLAVDGVAGDRIGV